MSIESLHTFDDPLAHWDAVETAERVRRGEVSAEEVVQAAIRRAERVDPTLRGVATPDYERALSRAKTAAGRPFAGVPTFIKEMIDVEGMPGRWGTEALRDMRPAKKNCLLVQAMEDSGIVSLGTSTMPEFGLTNASILPDGTGIRNPWNLARGSGASSSGAGVLAAAGVVPLAHGCDGGGSVRIPASCCGLVGLKPSLRRFPLQPSMALLPVKISVDGVLTRSVRDTALYYSEIERHYRHPKLPPVGHVTQPLRRRLRIGVIEQARVGKPYAPNIQHALSQTVTRLEQLGHAVEPVPSSVTEEMAEDFLLYFQALAFGAIHTGRIEYDRSFDKRLVGDFTWGLARAFQARMFRLPGAIRRLRRHARAYREGFAPYDLFLTPTLSTVARPLEDIATTLPYETLIDRAADWLTITPVANVAGTASISLPLAHDAETNLPIGMMFDANFGQEALLLELALELEAAFPWPSLATINHAASAQSEAFAMTAATPA